MYFRFFHEHLNSMLFNVKFVTLLIRNNAAVDANNLCTCSNNAITQIVQTEMCG